MRDPKRIKPFLKKLENLWLMYPDMRFFQLMFLLKPYDNDGFYIEDHNIEKQINKFLGLEED